MSDTIIVNGTLVLPDVLLKNKALFIKNSKIARIGAKIAKRGALIIDARGCFIAPGFIDTHIHGEPREIFRNETPHGTTSVVIALSCAPLHGLYAAVGRIKSFIGTSPLGANVLGVRFEGPYISPEKAGAQDRRYIRKPRPAELAALLRRCGPLLRMITIAPEVRGALSLIRSLKKKGVIASLGHSNSTFDEARSGIAAGIGHATHLFNAMRGMDSRQPGAVGAVLSDRRVVAEMILDRVHVHPYLFGLALQAKGPGRIVLVTDSVRASQGEGVRRARGAYRFSNGKLAGSSLTMIGAVKNAVHSVGLDLPSAVRLATLNPARLLGAHDSKGSLGPGKDADIVIFDKAFNVRATIIGGEIMYRDRISICAA